MTKAQFLSAIRSISPGQGIALAGLAGAVAYTVVHAPPGTFAALAEKDPGELGVWVAAALIAFGGVFTQRRTP